MSLFFNCDPVELCPFCKISQDALVLENEFAFAIDDRFPVTFGHLLVIPKRHVESYFDLTRDELNACDDLLRRARSAIISKDSSVCGFNIGINDGHAAGQTIAHCHIHLIPRRAGDTENPRGGVRGAIPGKQQY